MRFVEQARDRWERLLVALLPKGVAERRLAEHRRRAFEIIELERRWGDGPASGWGSTLDYTRVARDIIVEVVQRHGIRSILDLPCGDFAWMPKVLERLDPALRYVGGDIVPALIERNTAANPGLDFQQIDFVRDPLPTCDLIVCREALQHLPVADIARALRNFSASGARFLLTSTHLRRTGWRNGQECRVGRCRDRNLMLPPFNLPDPIAIYAELDPKHKFLGLWNLPFRGDEPSG